MVRRQPEGRNNEFNEFHELIRLSSGGNSSNSSNSYFVGCSNLAQCGMVRGSGSWTAGNDPTPLDPILTVEGRDPMASLRKRGKTWYVRYRDAYGKQVECKAGPDKGVAKTIANRLESQVRAIKTGVADPREARWAEAERKPLADHVHDWHAYLTSKGSVPKHCDQSRDRVLRLIQSAKIVRISGLTIGSVQTALADVSHIKGRRRNVELSESSIAHHARAVKAFSRWLWRDGRVRDDALVHMRLPEVHDKFVRRALEPEEAATLIAVTPTLRRRGGLTGADRAVVYAVAMGTGYRLGELCSLTPESFHLDDDPPTIFCEGEFTKNGRDATQPIWPELAEMLRPWLVGKAPGKPVFPINRDNAAPALRLDLEAAGVDSAASYDFHSLRHTYVTMLIKSGAVREGLPGTGPACGPETDDECLLPSSHPRPRPRTGRACPHIAHNQCLLGSKRDRWDRGDFQSWTAPS